MTDTDVIEFIQMKRQLEMRRVRESRQVSSTNKSSYQL